MNLRAIPVKAIFACLSLLAFSTAWAADKKADPVGTWKWTAMGPNNQTREVTMKLKAEGDKVVGTISGRNNDNPIEQFKQDGDEITFVVVRERNGNKVETKYKGKLEGDTIKGKITFNANGEDRTRDWEAKREAAKGGSASGLAGNWKYSFTTAGGQTMEPTLKLKEEGGKITGVVVINNNESPVSEVKVEGKDVTFQVERERNGQKFTSKYKATVDGDTLKGKITSNFGGNERTYDLDAKRVKE